MELWREMVAGGGSEDAFEHRGRHYVVARRASATSSIERRHGDSNKRIAHDLALSPWTVASYLRRAGEKLGTTSRVAMTRRLRQAA